MLSYDLVIKTNVAGIEMENLFLKIFSKKVFYQNILVPQILTQRFTITVDLSHHDPEDTLIR